MRSPGSSSSKRPSINSATSLASTPSAATRVWMVRSHRSKTMRRPGPDLMLSTMESQRPDFVGGRQYDPQRDLTHCPSLHARCGILRLVPVGHLHFYFKSD